jgi:hypothetical protein
MTTSWTIFLAILVAGVICVAILNARPMKCPHCERINVFRRRRTGLKREEHDHEEILRRTATEFICHRCSRSYWIVWDDFAGRSAERSTDLD